MRVHKLITLTVGLILVAGACGTRLDEGDFRAAAGGGEVETTERGGEIVDAVTGETIPTEGEAADDGSGSTSGAQSSAGPRTTQPGATGGNTGGGGSGGAATVKTSCGENTASDVGVTPASITVGNLTARGGALGPEAFAGPYEGARAFFLALNAAGGVCGRKIKFVTCDDKENSDKNKECVRKLIDDQKIFSFVGNATRSYAGAPEVNAKQIPDVGGIPISNAYEKWPYLFSLYGGDGNSRDGTEIGRGGKVHIQSGFARYFKEQLGVTKGAVIFYDEPISRTAGNFITEALEREGIEVVYTPNNGQGRNLADPAWDGEVIRMRAEGAEIIFQAIDIAGFQKLCDAMDRNGFQAKAAVTTIAGWSQTVGSTFSSPCRNSIWATGSTVPYSVTSHPEVKKFRAAMAQYSPNFAMRQWAVDGWAAAALFVEGLKSMGASPTREGMRKYLNGLDGSYQGPNDIMEPDNWDWRPNGADFSAAETDCLSVAKWEDSAGAFIDKSGKPDGFVCYQSTYFTYEPVPDGST